MTEPEVAALERQASAIVDRLRESQENRIHARQVLALCAAWRAQQAVMVEMNAVAEGEPPWVKYADHPAVEQIRQIRAKQQAEIATFRKAAELNKDAWDKAQAEIARLSKQVEVRTVQRDTVVRQQGEALEEMERAGWPCRLVEAPAMIRSLQAEIASLTERVRELEIWWECAMKRKALHALVEDA